MADEFTGETPYTTVVANHSASDEADRLREMITTMILRSGLPVPDMIAVAGDVVSEVIITISPNRIALDRNSAAMGESIVACCLDNWPLELKRRCDALAAEADGSVKN